MLCSKAGSTYPGTLHLTAHHLIFAYDEAGREELWVSVVCLCLMWTRESDSVLCPIRLYAFCSAMQIPYPLIALVTRLPQTLLGRCPITIRTRTFETITLSFKVEQEASDVFDSVKDLTVSSTSRQSYP